MPIHVGGGYGGDSDWIHGMWKGDGFTERLTYDMTDPAIIGRAGFGVIDHVGRAVCTEGDGDPGRGVGTVRARRAGPSRPVGLRGLADGRRLTPHERKGHPPVAGAPLRCSGSAAVADGRGDRADGGLLLDVVDPGWWSVSAVAGAARPSTAAAKPVAMMLANPNFFMMFPLPSMLL